MNQTAICNLALLRIGIATPIADITESSVAARALNSVWEQCVRTMLRERPWPFAIRQVDLALVGTQIFSDWQFTYRYPSNFINIHRINAPIVAASTSPVVHNIIDRAPAPQSYPYAVGSDASGKLIHTDIEEAIVLGTVYITDVSMYDPLFTSALSWFLGAEIALSLTKNRDIYGNAKSQYDALVSEAAAASLNEPKPREVCDADMIQARG